MLAQFSTNMSVVWTSWPEQCAQLEPELYVYVEAQE